MLDALAIIDRKARYWSKNCDFYPSKGVPVGILP